MSTRDFSWGKGGRCVRLTTYHPHSVVPNVKKIRGLNLPGTPWASSTCCGRPLPLPLQYLFMWFTVHRYWNITPWDKLLKKKNVRIRLKFSVSTQALRQCFTQLLLPWQWWNDRRQTLFEHLYCTCPRVSSIPWTNHSEWNTGVCSQTHTKHGTVEFRSEVN
jgi:hypothetical protein